MACTLYMQGERRQPKVRHRKTFFHLDAYLNHSYQDLDILCITDYTGGEEAIKRRLCEANDRFYTVPARNPRNRWNVLWWRTESSEPGFQRFKVDILVPGVMDLPYILPRYIMEIDELPCAPLDLLLFHKLKAWNDRLYVRRPDLRAKLPGDIQDIGDLLWLANWEGLDVTEGRQYITDPFREASYRRVKKFCLEYPEYAGLWIGLGLPDPAEL